MPSATSEVEVFQFDGHRLKEDGTATVLDNDQDWTRQALECLKSIPDDIEFPADWFRAHSAESGLAEPQHPNAWGAVIHHAAKLGLIEQVGYAKSKLPSAHARIVCVWKRKGAA